MKENACELLSSMVLCNESLLLRGKSIEFQQHPHQRRQLNNISNKSSINSSRCEINVNPMRHSKRIKQLFLPVCRMHDVKHEIANHYRDVKQKKTAKDRAKAKQSVAAMFRQRKKTKFAKLVSTTISHRRPPTIHRRLILSKREVLQIPSFTFPRYENSQKIDGRSLVRSNLLDC